MLAEKDIEFSMDERLTGSAEIIRSEIVGGFIVEVIDEPTMSQWAISHIGHAQFFGCLD
jgi:hypothetical protein